MPNNGLKAKCLQNKMCKYDMSIQKVATHVTPGFIHDFMPAFFSTGIRQRNNTCVIRNLHDSSVHRRIHFGQIAPTLPVKVPSYGYKNKLCEGMLFEIGWNDNRIIMQLCTDAY